MHRELAAVMNDTKWDELRLAMYALTDSPKWRTCDLETNYISDWDGEWFYHLRDGGYSSILWLEIAAETAAQKKAVVEELEKIRVPGFERDGNIVVVGYVKPDQPVDYIST